MCHHALIMPHYHQVATACDNVSKPLTLPVHMQNAVVSAMAYDKCELFGDAKQQCFLDKAFANVGAMLSQQVGETHDKSHAANNPFAYC